MNENDLRAICASICAGGLLARIDGMGHGVPLSTAAKWGVDTADDILAITHPKPTHWIDPEALKDMQEMAKVDCLEGGGGDPVEDPPCKCDPCIARVTLEMLRKHREN